LLLHILKIGGSAAQNKKGDANVNTQDLTPRCDGSFPHGDHDKCLNGMSLAMVYSPCQAFEELYPVDEAICHGTLFAALDKPFWGARRVK
jgi:hypothetical protein